MTHPKTEAEFMSMNPDEKKAFFMTQLGEFKKILDLLEKTASRTLEPDHLKISLAFIAYNRKLIEALEIATEIPAMLPAFALISGIVKTQIFDIAQLDTRCMMALDGFFPETSLQRKIQEAIEKSVINGLGKEILEEEENKDREI